MMDRDDLELFERSLRSATEANTGPALDAALVDVGWHDALAVDARAAVSTLFELQGAANVTSSALDHVVLGALGVDASGVVLPAIGRWTPPGDIDGDSLRVTGIGTAALAGCEQVLVPARHDDKEVAVAVPSGALTVRTIEGVDPALGLVEVRAEAVRVEAEPEPLTGYATAVGLAQVAVGHELVGAARTMLELAREHALERVQFDRPIAMFQAIRHRLAETLVAIETAGAALDAAWLDPSPQTAAMAKAIAGRSARTTARHCQQVLAGIGFTTEHVFHLYLRRVLVLEQLFGSTKDLTTELGAELLRTRRLPPLLPL